MLWLCFSTSPPSLTSIRLLKKALYEFSLQDKVRPPAPLERGVNAHSGVARLWVRDQREEAGVGARVQEAWGGVQHTQVREFSLFLWLVSYYLNFHHCTYIINFYIFSDLDNKSTLIGGNSPALLALLAGAYLYTLNIETTLYCVVYIVYSVLCLSSHAEVKTVSLCLVQCPTCPMQAPSFLILPLGVNSLAASLQKRFKISASLCLSFVALSSYHTQLSTYVGTA